MRFALLKLNAVALLAINTAHAKRSVDANRAFQGLMNTMEAIDAVNKQQNNFIYLRGSNKPSSSKGSKDFDTFNRVANSSSKGSKDFDNFNRVADSSSKASKDFDTFNR
eukprot:CAMPEP_0172534416 /NCGR_PEP_ID=MMETSP1067-20121228/6791_1 /TAXON_ID=265564 ORGANISM="Thalassiosira punctigera, Strain Tpunct2005C2" /NCGR_SAMPLE_ID=MMETSP1067 /ASSEMBLY_ACC=CAM_ASM_000444 /LENGTH=108 /DNA_ID=CAMNT_0013319207 /DNA_START=1 /DNA_END=323 /DNA_ORIENTATION=+